MPIGVGVFDMQGSNRWGRVWSGWLAAVLVGVSPSVAFAAGTAEEEQPRVIEVTASQFAFTPAEIEVAVGEMVRLLVRSSDVEHGLAISDLGISLPVPAGGQPVAVDFVAREAGTHQITCSVFCGAGHGRMAATLRVVGAPGQAAPTADGPDAAADRALDPLEPDFNLVALPSTLRMPQGQFAFRLTHRFTRPLDGGPGYGNLAEDLFGLDSPANIGLEFRYGLLPGTQIGIYRGNNKNIQLFARQNLLWSRGPSGLGVDIQASVEGAENLSEHHSGSISAIVSKRLGERLMVYAQPTFVSNVDRPGRFHLPRVEIEDDDDIDDDEDETFFLGLGARLRVRPSVYVVGEFVPRLGGYDEGQNHVSFAIEKQAGGHTFQLNVSNNLGSTPNQLAQGGDEDDWFIGFNITRKFY